MKFYVVSGSHAQTALLAEALGARLSKECVHVSDADQLRGLDRNTPVFFFGTWRENKKVTRGIDEIASRFTSRFYITERP